MENQDLELIYLQKEQAFLQMLFEKNQRIIELKQINTALENQLKEKTIEEKGEK